MEQWDAAATPVMFTRLLSCDVDWYTILCFEHQIAWCTGLQKCPKASLNVG